MSIPSFDGEFFEQDPLLEAGRDFGGLVQHRPRAVLRARSVDDVVRAVRYAREQRLNIGARGQGHTTRGQSQVEDGIVVDMRWLCQLETTHEAVRAGAGARWDTLLRHTLKSGQTPPVLTDYLGLSVGGTLSVGGVGGQSFRHGFQSDNVEELLVVTGTAEVVRCSKHEHTELFDACRAGLGQYGIIVEARLRLIEAPKLVRVHQLFYSTLDAYLADQEKLIADGRFDYVLGSLLPQGSDWGLAVEAVEYVTSAPAAERSTLLDGLAFTRTGEQRERAFEDYALRLDAMVESMKRGGTWTSFHPWMDLFISAQSARGLIRAAMEEFEPAELADGYVMTYPLNRSACNTPALGLPSGPQLYLFDVLPNIPTTERSRLSTFEDKCRKVYAKARVADATVYPIGYPVGEMNEGDWRRQFGLNCERLVAAKRLFDPDGILTPGPQVFAKDKAP